MNEVARKHGFPGIYTMMNIGCCNDNEYYCGWGRIPKMRVSGFDSVFAYNSGARSDLEKYVNPGGFHTQHEKSALLLGTHCRTGIAVFPECYCRRRCFTALEQTVDLSVELQRNGLLSDYDK